MAHWTYIASGLSHLYKNRFTPETHPELCSKIVDMTDRCVDKFPGHSFGVLFNAFTEKSKVNDDLTIFQKYEIHADSGGLQMKTLGKEITEDGKDLVYRTQAKHADIGMSFDEIPVTTEKNQHFLDSGKRYFDRAIFKECAIQSGKNLTRQIEVYLEEKSKCKPFMIVQGNTIEYFQQWSDILLETIPVEYHRHIGGVASSSFSLGNGPLEDIERAFTFTQLNIPDHIKMHCHFLGVGSPARLIPPIQFLRSGAFDPETIFTYDSTSATSGLSFGRYTPLSGKTQTGLTRFKDTAFYQAYDVISEYSRDVLKFDFNQEDFYDVLCQPVDVWNTKYTNVGRTYERNAICHAFFLYSVMAMMASIDRVTNNELEIINLRSDSVDNNVYMTLSSVKTLSDYNHWKSHVGRHILSKAVKTDPSSNIEEFFN